MFKSIWQYMDGKKVWSAVIGAVMLYGVPYCRARWPWLPWDEVLIPLLMGLGGVGLVHKMKKRVDEKGGVI